MDLLGVLTEHRQGSVIGMRVLLCQQGSLKSLYPAGMMASVPTEMKPTSSSLPWPVYPSLSPRSHAIRAESHTTT